MQPSAEQVGKGIGHFVGAMRIDAFRPIDDFKRHMDNWIETFRKCEPTNENERVIIPGDPEEMTQERLNGGIPLLMPVVEDLMDIGKTFGVKL